MLVVYDLFFLSYFFRQIIKLSERLEISILRRKRRADLLDHAVFICLNRSYNILTRTFSSELSSSSARVTIKLR